MWGWPDFFGRNHTGSEPFQRPFRGLPEEGRARNPTTASWATFLSSLPGLKGWTVGVNYMERHDKQMDDIRGGGVK